MTLQPPATTRLHITPLDQDLLHLVLPSSIRSLASNISFHDIPTFPENNYGYVTLPTMEADKIKKKLNGSILKGRKFKVESARPDKRGTDEQLTTPTEKSSIKKSKKRKAEDNVLEGFELPLDRKVKRGWTESSNDKTERRKKEKKAKDREEKPAKSQSKSKYTEKAECLFRTNVPPNKQTPTDEKSKKKSKKSKQAPGSVVHEFSQTLTHPTFLRADDGGKSLTSTFEEGKGWVDEAGDLKEPVSERVRKDQYRPGQVVGHKEKPKRAKSKPAAQADETTKNKSEMEDEAESAESEDWTSSSGSESESDSDGSETDDTTSSSSSGSSEVSKVSSPKQHRPETLHGAQKDRRDLSAETEGKSKERPAETGTDSQEQPKEVHPLEALFKRPAEQEKPKSESAPQFSFFDQEDIDSEEETSTNIAPLTPFSKRDLQDRGLRSAAPTPDTSHVVRTIKWNSQEHPDELVGIDSPVPKSITASKEESDFAKWFWDNRGDNNRAWKKRRRDAAKEQRQRENRRKGMKGKS